jgi:molecular chaperone GrpE (heat shock protein)
LVCGQLFSSLFFFDFHRTNFSGFRRTLHQFRSGWLCYFCYSRGHSPTFKAEEKRKAERQRQAEEERQSKRQREQERERRATRDWWKELAVAPNASMDEITRAYRRKVQQYHPDRVSGLGPELIELAEHHTRALNAAYAEAKRVRR